ncbi:uncharacterized protein [Diadema antillarum]|uniref:uncharacterized protein n=1 Tax=Diadema antillarum TaxID=105358 RepID=UPI003A8486A4
MIASSLDPERNQQDWDERIPYAMLAYRSAVQESTGETPVMMMLGREVTLPVDLMFSTPASETEEREKSDYAQILRHTLQEVHEVAREKMKSSAQRQAKLYDRNTKLRSYSKGDWVWLSGIQRKRGVCPKLMYKWSGPYLVTTKLSDVIYRIQESSRSKPKVVHLDRLKEYTGPPMRNWLQPTVRRNPRRVRTMPKRYDGMCT